MVGAAVAVQMRVELAYFNLADKNPALAEIDARLIEDHHRRWELIRVHSPNVKQPTAVAI